MKRYLGILGMALGFCLSAVPANAYTTIFADNFESGSFNSRWAMEKVVHSSSWNPTTALVTGPTNYSEGKTGYYGGWSPLGPTGVPNDQGGPNQGNYVGKFWPDFDYGQADFNNGGKQLVALKVQTVLTSGLLESAIADSGYIQMDLDYKFAEVAASSGGFVYMSIYSPTWDHWWSSTSIIPTNGGDWSAASRSLWLNPDRSQVNANILYGVGLWTSGGANGLHIDNVTVSTVPEPTSASLLGLGLAGLLATRFRRRS